MINIALMDIVSGSLTFDDLSPVPDKPNIYKLSRSLNPYAYMDDLFFCELNPFALDQFGLEDNRFNTIKGDDPFNIDFKKLIEKEAKKFNELVNKPLGWVELYALMDKRICLASYVKNFDRIPDDQKYDSFIEAYTNSENGFEILEHHYHDIFSYAKLSIERSKRLMSLALKYDDDKFTIYHGAKTEELFNPNDLYSWTLSKKVAEFFATRYGTPGEVWERQIDVTEAIDYIDNRGEEEVLYDYKEETI